MRLNNSVTEKVTSAGTQFKHSPKLTASAPGGGTQPAGQAMKATKGGILPVRSKAATKIHGVNNFPANKRNQAR